MLIQVSSIVLLFVSTTVKAGSIPIINSSLGCGPNQPMIVTEEMGFLGSPRFDNFLYYPANMDCSWTLKAPEGKAIQLKKMVFGLNLDCDTDVLRIYEGEGSNKIKTGELCGYWAPLRYRSKSNLLHLHFISGRTPRNVGFQFFFEQTLPIVQCKDEEISCRHRTKCVESGRKCDGVDDCDDGTDEESCDSPIIEAECGIPKIAPTLENDRIVGGRNAIPGSWPWQASLKLIDREPYSHMCGGALINRQWLLTAGHCFKSGNLDVNRWTVMFGKHFRLIPDETEQLRYMESIYIHPDYRGFNDSRPSTPWVIRKQHDVALVKLNAPLTINDYVIPVCLPGSDKVIPSGTMCYVTGWGETYGTGFEFELKQAAIPTVSRKTCLEWHRFFNITETMICAGYPKGGHDSCQGDSGGPLVHLEDSKIWSLVGIVSTGGSICAEEAQPGIYTFVPSYVDWIKTVINQ